MTFFVICSFLLFWSLVSFLLCFGENYWVVDLRITDASSLVLNFGLPWSCRLLHMHYWRTWVCVFLIFGCLVYFVLEFVIFNEAISQCIWANNSVSNLYKAFWSRWCVCGTAPYLLGQRAGGANLGKHGRTRLLSWFASFIVQSELLATDFEAEEGKPT